MFQADLLCGAKPAAASNGATFERRNPATGEVATRAAAATLDDVDAAVKAAQRRLPGLVRHGAGRAPRAAAEGRRQDGSAARPVRRSAVAEAGGAPMWYQFNVTLAANMLREAAAMTTQIAAKSFRPTCPARSRWACARPAAWWSASRPGMPRSSSARARSPCRSPAAIR
jgi:acyl-CoA reductase-like NAD-dependent aldehyde dehydrogenase